MLKFGVGDVGWVFGGDVSFVGWRGRAMDFGMKG